ENKKIKLFYSNDGDGGEFLYHALFERFYNETVREIEGYVNKGDVVIDAGANLGFFSLIASKLVGEPGKVIAFEPGKKNFQKLERNLRLNSSKNIIPVNMGLGSEENSAILNYNPSQTGLSSIKNEVASTNSRESISLISLTDYVKRENLIVKLIKIDTEGYEPEVLEGAREIITLQKPVIYVELGGYYPETSLQAISILESLGYKSEKETAEMIKAPAGTNFIFKSST
ncbi:MAG: FkbM family methyltransferase, partial [Ignavibacteriaceae bacterium]|nr:FkbM family methyltransferase [Ignavibacteriaceae bacterium]